MPQYFFHSQTGDRTQDDEGTYLAGDAEARSAAIRTFGEMVRDAPEGFWRSRPWTVTVTDAAGLVLYEVGMDGHSTPIAPG